MPREEFERYIQPLYLSISQLLKGEIAYGKKSILRIVNECRATGVCEDELGDEIIRLSDAIEAYAKGSMDKYSLANYLYKELTSGKDLSDLAILIVREICDKEFMEIVSNWSDDPEPTVRIAHLKCLMKLYDEDIIELEELSKFALDPSPIVRDALVSFLASHTDRKEVINILLRMLNRERRSSIRSKILDALSESLGDRKKEKRGSFLDKLLRKKQ